MNFTMHSWLSCCVGLTMVASSAQGNWTASSIGETSSALSLTSNCTPVVVDHYVPHVSTVPAIVGQTVNLFVREKQACEQGQENGAQGNSANHERDDTRRAVLMLTGSTQPAVSVFDLHYADYNWSDYLAQAGFDVFVMEVTGYGASPRPTMDDPCNTTTEQQKLYLIPNPLQHTCSAASYPHELTTIQTDWDDIDEVVNFIRTKNQVEHVDLVGWSLGGPRAGGYAARHPEKVGKLFLYAPVYDRNAPSDPPAPPVPDVPMQVRTISDFFSKWDLQIPRKTCPNEFDQNLRPVLSASIEAADPLGSTWGTQALWRAPSTVGVFGWNSRFSGMVTNPTLIIRGDNDTQVPLSDIENLYADLGSSSKVFVHVACAAHQMVWENQHATMLRASAVWLRTGTFDGQTYGTFAVDASGNIVEQPDAA